MPDEPSDNDQPWWMPPDRPEPAERDDLVELGRIRPTRPIGPLNLRAWSRRPYVVAGVAVAALLGGAGAALAATGPGTPARSPNSVAASPAPSPTQPGLPALPAVPGRTGRGFRWFGPGVGVGGLFGTLHGQLVVSKPGGGYQTVDVQNGQVMAVSTTSITIKSSDGFSKSYAVAAATMVDAQRDGIASVKVGDKAAVVATVSGSTATASSIIDLTLLRQGHPGFGYGPPPSGDTGAQAG
jgi:hypothetical protein